MGRQAGPSPEELEFIFECFLRRLSDRETLEEMQDTEFPLRSIRFVRDRRREFNAARKALEQQVRAEADHASVEQRKEHIKCLAAMGKRVMDELQLPSTSDIFSEPVRNEYHLPGKISWRVIEGGAVEVSLPVEAEQELQHLYSGFLGHLSTSGFSGITEQIRKWKESCGVYLGRCYHLLASVSGEITRRTGVEVSSNYEAKPGITVWFILTVCAEVVDGSSLSRGSAYERHYLSDSLHELRWCARTIAIAASGGELDSYEKMHRELRIRFGRSGEAGEIAELRGHLEGLHRHILSELRRFRLTVPLPGHCDLCRPTR